MLIIFIRLTVFGITHTKCSLMFIAPAINGFFPCKTTKIEANGRRSNIHTNIWIRREKIVVHLTVYKRRRYFPFKCNVHGALSPLLRFLYILAFVLSMIAQSEWVIGFFFCYFSKECYFGLSPVVVSLPSPEISFSNSFAGREASSSTRKKTMGKSEFLIFNVYNGWAYLCHIWYFLTGFYYNLFEKYLFPSMCILCHNNANSLRFFPGCSSYTFFSYFVNILTRYPHCKVGFL